MAAARVCGGGGVGRGEFGGDLSTGGGGDENLVGVNVFLDYESHDYGDFWRWSYGGGVARGLGRGFCEPVFGV